ncbi:bifunctional [glutamine synthetase] adenylyltransferase/[glutamine synthetase]-adenylyl-L-tyrosine phosphorylase [Aeromicrobium sp. CF3.5]|uniref:bifunctional [glutamine synthetase] adenylyltransferase/[glutamine synthetase]-adenylyl-L-tyrosine phosphorylase n=1 Tax=Aeromicrobium sp. CF3.5 TaxID=3373078 RepID=UPI003EE555B5
MPSDISDIARRGFRDVAAATRLIEQIDADAALIEQVSSVADPDGALSALAHIVEQIGTDRLHELLADDELRQRLLIVLGTSQALGELLGRRPEIIEDLAAHELSRSPLSVQQMREQMGRATDADSLRIAYHRTLLQVAARDLTALTTFEQSSAELSDLAVATLGAALDIARADESDPDACRLTIMAMGKTGGRELNYVSDVDVIFVHATPEGASDDASDHRATTVATRLASAVIRLCGQHTGEGTIWEVDPNLRPEGRDGPLVRSLASHLAYYERWASTWEFQALLKARFAAGDEELAEEYLAALSPQIWTSSQRDNFVPEVRAMRRRVIENIPAHHRDRELKLGAGGLRDVEFAVQLLQLVHGRVDEGLRSPTTMVALEALIDGGYVGRRDGAALAEAYEFLRTLEHRIQLHRLRRTHLVPEDDEDLRRIGRSMGFRTKPAEFLVKDWQGHRRVVRRLHEKLFYQPLLEAVSSLPSDQLRLTPAAAEQRLTALGFSDPRGALTHIQSLTTGVSRRASIQRSLLPAMLAWFAESTDPDAGLLAFRRISEELGESHWYLRKLRDEGESAEQLAHVLSSSRWVTDLILRAPDSVALLGDDAELVPRDRERLFTEVDLAVSRQSDGAAAIRTVRRIRRRELSRVGIADVQGRLDILEVGTALTDIGTATLRGALAASITAVEADRGPMPTRMAVILMGRLGGYEAAYGSDADVMFVHDPLEGAEPEKAAAAALAVAQNMRKTLAAAGDDPPLELDAELRPEGKNGSLVRSFESYRSYYDKWSAVWEAQALLRARATIGDSALCERFTDLINPLRWPDGGATAPEVREIRRIKARVDAERLPRGANPNTHLKLGRGGLADVEWTVQLLQMQHAYAVPDMRTTGTIAALRGAVDADLMATDDADSLEAAWRMVSRIRNAVVLMRAKPAESMVEDAAERAGVAHLLGYGADGSEELVDDYLRITRQARRVVEQTFYA